MSLPILPQPVADRRLCWAGADTVAKWIGAARTGRIEIGQPEATIHHDPAGLVMAQGPRPVALSVPGHPIDKHGVPVDFLLTAKRDLEAAKRFFRKMLKDQPLFAPDRIGTDGGSRLDGVKISDIGTERVALDLDWSPGMLIPTAVCGCKDFRHITGRPSPVRRSRLTSEEPVRESRTPRSVGEVPGNRHLYSWHHFGARACMTSLTRLRFMPMPFSPK